MGRAKEFEPEQVVGAAMELFWRQGYANTSMQDLVDCLGIGRGSIYATFGSKHELWVRALTRYSEDGARAMLEVLESQGPFVPTLRRALVALVDHDLSDPHRKGCMLVNAAMETVPADPVTSEVAARNFDRIESGIANAIRRAKAEQEVAESVDEIAVASLLLTLIEGLRVVAKATPDRERLMRAIDMALASLAPA